MLKQQPNIIPMNYLLLGNDNGKQKPIGVISNSHEIKILNKQKIPNSIKEYLIKIEDRRFFTHRGIDYKSIFRAMLANLKNLSIVQGGSTITQQLARNILRCNNKTIYRKILEVKTALLLEKTYTKEQILELYFNNVYWGKNIYGIRAASLTYFNKEPYKLNKIEQIKLIALLRGPNIYIANSNLLLKRMNLLIKILKI